MQKEFALFNYPDGWIDLRDIVHCYFRPLLEGIHWPLWYQFEQEMSTQVRR